MQINRLFEIIYILLNKKSITAHELSLHFEVSQRTIYRDIDTLCQCGIPIYTSKGKGGGISLLDNFILNKSLLSENEQNDILSALQSLKATNYPPNDSTISKLSNLFGTNNTDWIQINFSDWKDNSQDNFSVLKYAILNNKVVSFDYYSSYGEKTTRNVEPIQLWFKSKNWYLKGFCKLKEKSRLFKLSRMKNLALTEDTFVMKKILNEDNFQNKNDTSNNITVTLHIDASQSYRVYDEFDYDQITINEDNSFIVTASYPAGEWVYSYILSFGQYARVLQPEFLKDQIKKQLSLMLNLYL